ncbi:RsmD family RNA methyltransferase [Jiangella gansuensis]|uniref:RsmD family RNA methyltransferase n=1 Tax=Jiangella gansuensis TaxID=281473 RepID=UPI00047CB83C|nr:RsmD family RNA methyltransferase [Jiangella gansuensis]
MNPATTSPPAAAVHEYMTFGSLSIGFDDRVLRPRPWTVNQARWAADLLRAAPPGPVLELCAGAGQIGLLAVAGSGRHLVQVDADPVACGHARANAARAAGRGVGRVEVRQGTIDEALRPGERYALILADPPWVPSDAVGRFPEDPVAAIDGGADGLDVMRRCLTAIDAHLADGGSALAQLGTLEQALSVRDHAADLDVLAVRSYQPHGVLVLLRRFTASACRE